MYSCTSSSLGLSYQNQIEDFPDSLETASPDSLETASELSSTHKTKVKAVIPNKRKTQPAHKSESSTKRKGRGSGRIKRPPNAFILFRSHAIATEMKQEDYRHNLSNASRLASVMWNNLSAEKRQVWQDAAQRAKEEHQLRFPDYKFEPRKPNAQSGKSEKSKAAKPPATEEKKWDEATVTRLINTARGEDEADGAEERTIVWQSATARRRQDQKQRSEMALAERRAIAADMKKQRELRSHGMQCLSSRQRPSTSAFAGKRILLAQPPSGRRTSAAGDLASAFASQELPSLASETYPMDQLSKRRSSSVPASGSLPDINSANASPAHSHAEVPRDDVDWTVGEPALRDSYSLLGRSNLRPMTASPLVSSLRSPTPSRRKAAPPPIGLGPTDSHIARLHNLDRLLADTTPSSAVQGFWMSRPKTMASATPRSRHFQMAAQGLKDGRCGDYSLVSPMQRSASGSNRTSAAWQNWERSEEITRAPDYDLGAESEEAGDPTPRAFETTFFAASKPYRAFDLSSSAGSSSSSSMHRLPPQGLHAEESHMAHADDQDMDCSPFSENDVFAFSPDFLDSTANVTYSMHGASRAPSVESTLDDSDDIDAILADEICRSVHNSPMLDPRLSSPSQPLSQSVSPLLHSSAFQVAKSSHLPDGLMPVSLMPQSEGVSDHSFPPLPITPGAPPRSILHPFDSLRSPTQCASSPFDMPPTSAETSEATRLREFLFQHHGRGNARALTRPDQRVKRRYRKRQKGKSTKKPQSATKDPEPSSIQLLPVPLHAADSPETPKDH